MSFEMSAPDGSQIRRLQDCTEEDLERARRLVLADLIRVDEHARIRALVQAKARRLADLGRSRDADRWRAFSEWLRAEGAPPKEKGR